MSSRVKQFKDAYGGGRLSVPVKVKPGTANRQQRRAMARQQAKQVKRGAK